MRIKTIFVGICSLFLPACMAFVSSDNIKNDVLPPAYYAPGEVHFNIKVVENEFIKQEKCQVYYTSLGKRGGTLEKKEIPENGIIDFDINLDYPTSVILRIGERGTAYICTIPKDTVACEINFDKQDSSAVFSNFTGKLAQINNDVNSDVAGLEKLINSSEQSLAEMLKGCSVEKCKDLIDSVYCSLIETIEASNICVGAQSVWKMKAERLRIEWWGDFRGKYTTLWLSTHGPKPLTRENYQTFVDTLQIPNIEGHIDTDFSSMESVNSPHALFGSALILLAETCNFEVISDSYNRQLALLHADFSNVKSLDSTTEAFITDSKLVHALLEKRQEMAERKANLTSRGNVFINSYDDIDPQEILAVILKKYEGKVVMIDVWATWCGPCKAGHKQMIPLKEEFVKDSVAFVYITSPTSPLDTWTTMIPEISGDHYYLTAEQYSFILSSHQSQGIPTYLIFDKTGKLVFKQIGLAENDIYRDAIIKALE